MWHFRCVLESSAYFQFWAECAPHPPLVAEAVLLQSVSRVQCMIMYLDREEKRVCPCTGVYV